NNNCFDNCGFKTLVIYPGVGAGHTQNRATVLTDGTVTNGAFTSDLSGWTVGGTVTQSGGKAAFNNGTLEQSISISAPYINAARKHVVKFKVTNGTAINVKVGTTSGGGEILASTTITVNPTTTVGAVAFTPTASPFYLQFISAGTVKLDDVSLLTD